MPQLQALARNLTSSMAPGGLGGQMSGGNVSGSFFNPPAQTQSQSSGYPSQLNALYGNLLGRAPDAAGASFYTQALNSGTPASMLPTYMQNSPEYQLDKASGLIGSGGNYSPMAAPTPALQNSFFNNSTPAPMGTNILGANFGGVGAQLGNQAGNNMTSLSQLYANTLGRAPDAQGLSFYMNALNNGTNMGQVGQYIGASPEAAANGMGGSPAGGPFGMINMPANNNPSAGIAALRQGVANPISTGQTPSGTNPTSGSPSGTAPLGTPVTTTPPAGGAPATPAPSGPSFAQQIQNIANLPGAGPMMAELGYTPATLQQLAQTGTVTQAPSASAISGDNSVVQGLYQNMLGRAGTPDELSYYTNLIASGTPMSQIQAYFQNSPEYKAKQ